MSDLDQPLSMPGGDGSIRAKTDGAKLPRAKARGINVFLYGEHVGRARDSSTGYEFEFTDAGMRSAHLSLALPNTKQRHADLAPGDRVSAWLHNLLPDDPSVRETLARELGIRPGGLSLLSAMGLDCAGAVQFTTEDTLPERPRSLEPMSDDAIADALRNSALLKKRQPRPREDKMHGRFGAAGFQTKFTLRLIDGEWFLPDGDEPSSHIVKPTIKSPDIPHQAFIEHITMDTARRLGLTCAATEYRTFDGEECIIVERYDRVEVEGVLKRIHQEDFCAALSVDPDNKYNVTASQIKTVLENSSDTATDTRRAFEALVFNALIGGGDAHAKNLSVLISPTGFIRLAPLYDMASAFPYAPSGDLSRVKDRIAIPAGKVTRFADLDRNAWDALARELGLDVDTGRAIMLRLAEELPDALEAALRASEGPDSPADWARSTPMLTLLQQSVTSAIDMFERPEPRSELVSAALPPVPVGTQGRATSTVCAKNVNFS